MRNPKITLTNNEHRNKEVISVVFGKDYSLINKVKSLPWAIRSKSRKFWHIPLRRFNLSKPPDILRHCFATHQLEQGIDLRFIQKLMGNESSILTEIYTDVSKNSFTKFKNLLDDNL